MERLCIFCPGGHVESESHVLMSCRYSDLRSNIFHVAKSLIANFNKLDVNSRFIAFLESVSRTQSNTYNLPNIYILYLKGELKLWILVHVVHVTLMSMTVLKLPSLFAARHFLTFHNKLHNNESIGHSKSS